MSGDKTAFVAVYAPSASGDDKPTAIGQTWTIAIEQACKLRIGIAAGLGFTAARCRCARAERPADLYECRTP